MPVREAISALRRAADEESQLRVDLATARLDLAALVCGSEPEAMVPRSEFRNVAECAVVALRAMGRLPASLDPEQQKGVAR